MSTPEPTNLIERAAAAAMDAAEAALAEQGATVNHVYVALVADDVPEGELDACAAASGTGLPEDEADRARSVVAFLVSEAAQTGKALGLDIRIVPMAHVGGQG